MRSISLGIAMTFMLAACNPAPAPESIETPTPPEPQAATFEDGGCIGALLLHRNVVVQGQAPGEEPVLTTALTAWRAGAAGVLSVDELAQYEASSVAVQDDESPAVIAQRAATCVTSAPQ